MALGLGENGRHLKRLSKENLDFFSPNILKRTKLMTGYNQAVIMHTTPSHMQQQCAAFSAAIQQP